MDVIPWRNGLHCAKARVRDSARKNHVSIQPFQSGSDLCERHPHLKSDPSFLRKYPNWTNLAKSGNDCVEERADLRRLATKMMGEVMSTAGVRLVAVRETSPALFALPKRPLFISS